MCSFPPKLFIVEQRPGKAGGSGVRQALPRDDESDLPLGGINVGSRVHEYGGGSVTAYDETLFVSNLDDSHVYAHPIGSADALRRLTPEPPIGEEHRYADLQASACGLLAVREIHRGPSTEAANEIVRIAVDGRISVEVLAAGHAFYAFPRISPDGSLIAFTAWDHPNMPWDSTHLYRGRLTAEGSISELETLAGGSSESVLQPTWAPDGNLYFVSDRTGWWNLYALTADGIRATFSVDADVGLPQWRLGMSRFAFFSNGLVLCAVCKDAEDSLVIVDPRSGETRTLDLALSQVHAVVSLGGPCAVMGASPESPEVLLLVDDQGTVERVAGRRVANRRRASVGRHIAFPSGDTESFGFFYPASSSAMPRHRRGASPPLIVNCHGGPTLHATRTFNPVVQFWTSRGFAVLDINYRGSSGYGRAYRRAAFRRSGLDDASDCISGALYLASLGVVDRDRMAIRGASSGGFIVLCVLAQRHPFAAAANYFGIADLVSLADSGPKFESCYFDSLICHPAERKTLRERSPLRHVDAIRTPLIVVHGAKDPVVDVSQSRNLVASLRERNVRCSYLEFENERHGLTAPALTKALVAEAEFYARTLGA